MSNWYGQSISELQKLAEDDGERKAMQARLAELKAVNKNGVRCAMSKTLEVKLEKVLSSAE